MSSGTVEIRQEDGRYTAVDTATGAAGTGKTRAMALVALAAALDGAVGIAPEEADSSTKEVAELSARVQRRFTAAGVTEDDVDDAIEWARSQ